MPGGERRGRTALAGPADGRILGRESGRGASPSRARPRGPHAVESDPPLVGGDKRRVGRPARVRRTPEQSLAVVRRQLQAYADRRVFSGFSEGRPVAGRHRFRFSWLGTESLTLDYTPATGTFVFRALLPNVPARSALYADLAAFVSGRSSTRLPEHRRVERRRARVRCIPARGTVSVELVATRNFHDYGVNRVVNLVHEIFLYLQEYRPEYLWANFAAPEE
jgi:hypothetical protein